jgi:XTP/dITP diphosphohydrolase
VLALYRKPTGIPQYFEGICAGRILEATSGGAGFGYDPLFWSDELEKSFGDASDHEKDSVSHRARAFEQLRSALADG